MTERMLCLDIYLSGKDLDKSEKIRRRVAARKPKYGALYYYDEERWSNLRGGEGKALIRIAGGSIRGEIHEVEGIFEGGINIAAKVPNEEADRIRQDPTYSINAEFEIT